MTAEEIWTAENEADLQRVTADYEALRALKNRIDQRNAVALEIVAQNIIDGCKSADEDTYIHSVVLAGCLQDCAPQIRAALKPYDTTEGAT